MNVDLVLTRTRGLVGDPHGDWCEDELVLPLLAQAYEDLYGSLSSVDTAFNEKTIELPVIAAGTQDLNALGAEGEPLELLWEPRALEWKLAGSPATDYVEIRKKDRVLTVADRQDIASWEWAGGILYISPSTVDVDLRLRGMFLFPALNEPGDTIQPIGLPYILAYKTASLIGASRSNKFWFDTYALSAERGLEQLESRMVKDDQGVVRRRGRSMRPSMPFRGWPRLQK